MNFWTLFVILALLITADKVLTYWNIKQVWKNFPDAVKEDKYKIERNPLAKRLFEMYGLLGGTIVYWFFSIVTLFGAFYLLSLAFGERISLYILIMFYGLVIMNNFYFLLKYSKVIT